MGMKRCSRAWKGSLCLLMALAGTPACTDQLDEPAPIPDTKPASELAPGPNAPAQDAALPATPLPEELALEFEDDAPQHPLCGDPLLGADFFLDDAALPTLYVDPARDSLAPDGSQAAPFRTLAAALATGFDAAPGTGQAPGPTRRVLVASGSYDEDVAIPPGTLLLGGYDASSWEPGRAPSVIGGSVYLGTATAPAGIVSPEGYVIQDNTLSPPSPNAAPLTALRRFEVGAGVEVMPGTRALLRDNDIAPVLYRTTGDAAGLLRGLAVWAMGATLRADDNRLILPAEAPTSVSSAGFFTWNSCAWITRNQISDYRSPIYFYRGPGAAATFNVLQRAQNGVGTSGNTALIAANFIHAQMPFSGCVYALSMHEDAHPDIRDNSIYLVDVGNRGILEEDGASLPSALLRNRFFSSQAYPVLYVDHRATSDPRLTSSATALNSLPGVPTAGGNTLTRVGEMR